MRSVLIVALALNLMCASAVLGADPWVDMGPACSVEGLMPEANGDLYALGSCRVIKLPAGSSAWQGWSEGLPITGVHALTRNAAGDLYVTTSGAQVYTLPHGSTTWQPVVAAGSFFTPIATLAVDSGGTLYAGTGLGYVYRLPAGGSTWESLDRAGTADVRALVVDASKTVYAGTWGGGVYRLPAGGTTWESVASGLANAYVSSLALDPVDSVYAATGDGVYKLLSGASAWTAAGTGLPVQAVSAIAADRFGNAYAGLTGGVYKLPVGATGWIPTGTDFPSAPVLALAADPAGNLYAGTNDGVFKLPRYVPFSGSALVTQSACTNPAYNGTFGTGLILNVALYGTVFEASGTITFPTAPPTYGTFSIAGTIDAAGQLIGTFTIMTMWQSAGTFTGTLAGNTLTGTFSGAVVSGETCHINGSMAATTAGLPPAGSTPVTPSGNLATTTPAYTWNAVAVATVYRIWVNDHTGFRFTTSVTAAEAGCPGGTGTCSVTPPTSLSPGRGHWYVQTWNAAGYGPWSSGLSFTVLSPSSVGTFRPTDGAFYLDHNGNGQWDGCAVDRCLSMGLNGDIPLVGDWNGSGTAKVGTFRPSDGAFYLDYNGNGVWDGCGTDRCLSIGLNGDIPLVGDWNGSGTAKVGTFRPSDGAFYLDYNGNGVWDGCGMDRCLSMGLNGDTPLVGTW